MPTYCLIKDKNNPPDHNGYGTVNKNFLIHQSFISCEDYISFLNSIGASYKYFDLYNTKISQIIDKRRSIFTIKEGLDPQQPICYIGLNQLKIYCNWLNTQNLKDILDFPYNLNNNTKNIQESTLWIPSYDEWYKAVYFDSKTDKYWSFPNKSNKPDSEKTLSPYGLIDPGFVYYAIIDNSDSMSAPLNKYLIAGGCKNRNPINARAGLTYSVSDQYYAPYISARLCRKSDIKKFTLKLYDTYGDGWGQNHINILDSSQKLLYNNLSLKNGYGPTNIILEVDKIERNIHLKYIKQDNLSYENYYELYDTETQKLLYKSNIYETPEDNKIILIS
jgi:hypothetical protein